MATPIPAKAVLEFTPRPRTLPSSRGAPATNGPNEYGHPMLDIVFIAGGLAFFSLIAGYTALCERL